MVRRDRPCGDLASPRCDHRVWSCSLRTFCCRAAHGAPRWADRSGRSARSACGTRRVGDPAALAVGCACAVSRPHRAPGTTHPVVRDVRRILGGYERWRLLHRTTGLFVTAGFVHGVLDGTSFHHSSRPEMELRRGRRCRRCVLRLPGAARRVSSCRCTTIRSRRCVRSTTVSSRSRLRPIGRKVEFVPGQFAMVYLEAKDGWHRHPFTISSAPQEDVLRVTVKALGDYTSRLQELIEPGMPAVIGGPHGRFNHRKGTDRQVWIAGGRWRRAVSQLVPCARRSVCRIASTSSTAADGKRRSPTRSVRSPTAMSSFTST